jgi:phosphatidylglycerol:prolipoprotein diacylglycerol transferase
VRPILFVVPGWFPWLGGEAVYSYGALLGLALVVGWYVTLWRARRLGIEGSAAVWVTASAVACGLLGARALFFVTNPSRWHGWGSLWSWDSGGLVVYGGFLGGVLGAAAAARWLKVDLWRYADGAAPQLGLGLAIGRLGCFLYGCDFGRVTGASWGVRFPRWGASELPWAGSACGPGGACGALTRCEEGVCVSWQSAAWALHERLGWVEEGALWSAPVHPVQLYSAALGLLLAGVLWWRVGRRRFEGEAFLWLGVMYGVMRFFLETLREDTMRGSFFSVVGEGWWSWWLVREVGEGGAVSYVLTTSQGISACVVWLACVVWWRRRGGPGGAEGVQRS